MNSKQQRIVDAEAKFDARDLDSVCELADAVKAGETEMTETTIYRVTSESDSYGPDCADPMACARAIQDNLIEYANKRGYQVEVEIVDETESFNNRSKGNAELIAELGELVELNWPDWVPMTAFNC